MFDLQNRLNRIEIIFSKGRYIIHGIGEVLVYTDRDKYLSELCKIITSNVNTSHLYLEYSKETRDIVKDLYDLMSYKSACMVCKEYGMYIFPIEKTREDIFVFCDDFIYLPDIRRFINNFLIKYDNDIT